MKKLISIITLLIMLSTLFIITGCSKSNGKVVIYTSMEEDRNQVLKEQLKEKFPDINVVVQYMSTGNSSAKLKTEGTNIEADIILDLETAYMTKLEENFADLSNFDSSIFVDGVVKSTNYFPWVKYTMSLIIDKNYFAEHNLAVPKTYEDLLKPEYNNLIAMPDPKTSGTGYAFFLNTVNIMGEENAIQYFKSLKENLREFTASGSGPTNLLKQGEIAIAMGMTSQGAAAINEGYNFEIISLETGAPYNTTSCGIIKGRENNESVKKVFEWLSTEFIRYDKENYMPDVILKDQKNNVQNYPTNFAEANMDNIDSIETKEDLLEKWGEVNG
ncbi:MAG: extracellular solute-binding protein [Clostridia bacterium]